MTTDLERKLAALTPEKRALLEKKMRSLSAKKAAEQKIKPREGNGPWPASEDQEALWFFHQLDPGTFAYNNGTALRIKGPTDLEILTRAANEVVRRHEATRTTFYTVEEKLYQRVHERMEITLPITDLRDVPRDEVEDVAMALIPERLREPFDLEKGPLIYLPLLQLADDDLIIMIIMHHSLTDWWSFKLIARELLTIYRAFVNGLPSPLSEVPLHFVDYTMWRNEWIASDAMQAQMDYWLEALKGSPLVVELPSDRPRPAQPDYMGKRHYRDLPVDILHQLRKVTTANKASSLMCTISAAAAFLHRYAEADDILLGLGTTEREGSPEMENMVGYLLNILNIRAVFRPKITFNELVAQEKVAVVGALKNRNLPFRYLAQELKPDRDLSRMPVFQVGFNHVSDTGPVFSQHERGEVSNLLPGYDVLTINVNRGISDVDLQINFIEGLSSLRMILEWATALFDEETMIHCGELIENLMREMTARPDAPIDELDWLSADERHRLLEEWNRKPVPYDRETDLAALFHKRAAERGEAEAVRIGEDAISYADLAAEANRLANHLIELGLDNNAPVGICLPKSLAWVTAMVGVTVAGGHYVPLDPEYPRERLDEMIEMTGMALLVSDKATRAARGDLDDAAAHVIALDDGAVSAASSEAPAPAIHPESLVYTIFTSGTTGKPKGVQVPHRGLVRLVSDRDYFRVEPGETVAQTTAAGFDAHALEVWTSLVWGGRLCIVDKDTFLDAEALETWIRDNRIDHLHATPAIFNQHVQDRPAIFASLKQLLFGGEKMDIDSVRRVIEAGRPEKLHHLYGPTEAAVITVWYDVTEIPDEEYTLPLGGPVANSDLFVIDRYGHPAAVGVLGELCLGGDCLARGYLDDPAQTAEKFVPNPFADEADAGGRIYRTGDIVKWRRSGVLELIGRRDNQIKLRGYRIELGEIEAALDGHESVGNCVVIPRGERIVAYLVPAEGKGTDSVDINAIRDYAIGKLPGHMIPTACVVLERFPLTSNDKIDRDALPEPEIRAPSADEQPRNQTEQAIVDIWQELLGIEQIGIRDNFFALGAHSLMVTRAVSKLRTTLDVNVPIKAVFQAPTAEALAKTIELLLWTAAPEADAELDDDEEEGEI